MRVLIGVDPHKTTNAVAVVDEHGELLERTEFLTNRAGLRALERWSKRFPERRWAVEGANGLGRTLARKLASVGEEVVDVPAKLSARVRVLSTGNGRKNDALDATFTALAALRNDRLTKIHREDLTDALRLLWERREDLVSERTRVRNRLHGLLRDTWCPAGCQEACSPPTGRSRRTHRYRRAQELRRSRGDGAHPLHVARRSALKARTQAANQLRALLLTAPEELRAQLRGLSTAKLVAAAARFRPGGPPKDLRAATKLAMRSVARRHRRLSEEIAELEEQIARLVSEAAPTLAALPGVGTDTAASLLVAVGDNPERLNSEARPSPAFAAWLPCQPPRARRCATVSAAGCPRGGNRDANRDANRALHVLWRSGG